MSLVLNGSGSITGLSAGGLPDGSVTADDLASSLDLSGKTVTLPSGTGGKVLQVVSMNTNTSTQVSASSHVDTAITLLITPSSASSKILILSSTDIQSTANDTHGGLRLLRGATILKDFGTLLNTNSAAMSIYTHSFSYLDSPTTTSSTTYKLQVVRTGASGTIEVNAYSRYSTFTLMEIAA